MARAENIVAVIRGIVRYVLKTRIGRIASKQAYPVSQIRFYDQRCVVNLSGIRLSHTLSGAYDFEFRSIRFPERRTEA